MPDRGPKDPLESLAEAHRAIDTGPALAEEAIAAILG